ncbi:MAG: hypothetical protein WDO68_28335 [Gammaproteobacteria bacterium]
MKHSLFLGACALLLAAMSAVSQARSSSCDRECLRNVADQYLTALAAHDASSLPLARGLRYTENGQVLALTDGFWGTASAVGKYKQIFADSRGDEVGIYATMRENGTLVLLATRLRMQRGRITEIESIVSRPASSTSLGAERLERDGSNPLWEAQIPPAERLSREELIATANKYFVAVQKNDGKGDYPFTDDCYRFENGTLATGNAEMARLADEADAHPERRTAGQPSSFGYRLMSYPCRKQFETGYMKMVDRIRDRRFPIVDVERGTVFTFAFFDHSGTVHEVTTTDSKTHAVGLRNPFTWEVAECFRIEKKQIRAIEAILTQSPYGMKPNWPPTRRNRSESHD